MSPSHQESVARWERILEPELAQRQADWERGAAIRRMHAAGFSAKDVAARFSVAIETARKHAKGRTPKTPIVEWLRTNPFNEKPTPNMRERYYGPLRAAYLADHPEEVERQTRIAARKAIAQEERERLTREYADLENKVSRRARRLKLSPTQERRLLMREVIDVAAASRLRKKTRLAEV